MEKIKNIKSVNDLDYKLKVSYEKAKKNECFNELVSRINLSDDKLMKYTSKLEDASLEYENCRKCKRLSNCKNKMHGYCYLPKKEDDMLDFSYVSCKFRNEFEKDSVYLKNVVSIDIPREIRNARIKDIYTDDKNRQDVIKWILGYIKDYKKGIISKGMFLHGNFGCGKTYLLAAMLNELAKSNVKSVIVYWPEYLRSLKSCFQSSSSDEFKDMFNEIKYAKILLIDDLGAESVTSWNRDEVLGTILQYRMQEGLPTFITSNLNINELEDHLSITSSNRSEKVKASRIIERVKQLTVDVEMISKNNRK